MKHSEHARRRARGTVHQAPKLRKEGKLALSTIQLIECLYVLRNARDSVNWCTNGPICSSKVRSADIWGEGAEQEPIAAYHPHDHQAKSHVCPSKVRHSKANALVQEELMTIHGVLQPRMNIVLIVRCWRAICHREVHRQWGSKATSARNGGDHRPYHLNKFRGRIRRNRARRLDWLNIRANFLQFLRSHRNHNRDEKRLDQILSIVKKGLDRCCILAPFPNIPEGGVDRQVEQKRAKRISLSDTRTRLNRAVQERSIVGVELIHRGAP
jgi:hypothetical protein